MSEPIHDDEPDTSESVVRKLLGSQCPQWATSQVDYLDASGTDNAMWRIRVDDGPDVALRLPRRPGAAAGVLTEAATLQQVERALAGTAPVTPRLRHIGEASEAFPHQWLVLEWIDGRDLWSSRDGPGRSNVALAEDLADAVNLVGAIDPSALPRRAAGSRGGPLEPLLERLEAWLSDPSAPRLFDVDAVRRLAAEALEVTEEPVTHGFVHGDLIPGNLLVDAGHLTAIIDWGGAGHADLAQDLAPAWAVLEATERAVFRRAVDADEAAWIRGRTFELEHAVGGVLYYAPKRHSLGDVMARTLERILTEPSS